MTIQRRYFPDGKISERIKKAREDRAISASDLARLVGVTPTAVWNWEKNGIKPRPAAISDIARVFGVTTDFLLTGRESSGAAPSLVSEPAESVASILEDAKKRLARCTGLELDRIKLQFSTE